MLKEAIDKLQHLVEKQSAPQKLPVPELHGATKFVLNGQVIEVAHTPPPRNHEAHDLESLALLVKEYAIKSTNAVVWVGDGAITAVCDDEFLRANTVTLPNPYDERFTALSNSTPLHHRQFLAWCRHYLKEALEAAHPGLLTVLKTLRLTSSQSAASTVEQGRDSFSKEVVQAVSATANLPEEVIVPVPVFEMFPDIVLPLRCELVIDTDEAKLHLRPLALEAEHAARAAIGEIQDRVNAALADEFGAESTPAVVLGRVTAS